MTRLPVCEVCSSYMLSHIKIRTWLKCLTCGNIVNKKEIITNQQYFMGRDTQYKEELTDEIKNNSIQLLNRVNSLLVELGIETAIVSSGWRPQSINGQISGAAKKSLHMTGKAIDIRDDKDQKLGQLILSRPDLLIKFELWMEDLDSTKGKNTNWVHLDIGTRSERPIRVFKP